MWCGKSAKKEHSDRENCQENLRQRSYIDSRTEDTTKNIGGD